MDETAFIGRNAVIGNPTTFETESAPGHTMQWAGSARKNMASSTFWFSSETSGPGQMISIGSDSIVSRLRTMNWPTKRAVWCMEQTGLTVVAAPVFAADATPAAPAAPSATALAAASRVLVDIGVRSSLDAVVPNMLTELESQYVQNRPEIKDALHQVALTLALEFGKTEQGVLDAVAASLAAHMSEQELTATAAYFDSPAGKAWLKAQPFMVHDLTIAAGTWRQKLSLDMLNRAREEMKKKGFNL